MSGPVRGSTNEKSALAFTIVYSDSNIEVTLLTADFSTGLKEHWQEHWDRYAD